MGHVFGMYHDNQPSANGIPPHSVHVNKNCHGVMNTNELLSDPFWSKCSVSDLTATYHINKFGRPECLESFGGGHLYHTKGKSEIVNDIIQL